MCAIAGLFDTRAARPIDQALLERMTTVQRHRGPDGSGYHCEPGVGFGHRRLAIIDLEGGAQPLGNEDDSVLVTFNGEIYNFLELHRELEQAGHRFRTRSDTEVIVHAWEEWGPACVRRFAGMFAFALWDRNKQTLFLARDRLGKKPLHYTLLRDGWLAFGSELKALLAVPALGREVDPLAIEEYFAFGYVADPRTILLGTHKLPPGHTLLVRRGAPLPQPEEYWDVSAAFGRSAGLSDDEAAGQLIERLRVAVERRMIAEVPLGAFLSGGVDSSAIVSQMAQVCATPVKTCSISFGDPRFDEAQFAAQVAQRYRTDHSVQRVDPEDLDLLDQLVEAYDEPYADSSALPTYRVCQLARQRVTVALSGDAGDENLAGYRRYKWHVYEERIRRILPLALRRPLFGAAGAIYPKLDWAPRPLRAKATLQALARSSLEGYLHSVSIMGADQRARLFGSRLHRELQGYRAQAVFERHAQRVPGAHPLSFVQYLDFKTYLPGDILTKVDRASMAHGLEVRVPMLDHELVEWTASLDPRQKLRGAEGKFILKKALEPWLPREVMYRPKMGFAVPLVHWFRGRLRERVRSSLLGGTLRDCGYFDDRELARIVEEHESGRRDHSPAIWALLMFEGFQRRLQGAQTEVARGSLPAEAGLRRHA
jgi:asparagine synthase (glutamine-hydrolysing)